MPIQEHRHEKAKVSARDAGMSKAPTHPRQRDGLNDWADQGTASGSTRAKRAAPKRNEEAVLDTQSAHVISGLIDDANGNAVSDRRAHKRDGALETMNPIYILVGITIGIPALLLLALFGTNPGVQEGIFTPLVTFLVVSAFVTAMVFEIKRLADQASDEECH